jgi:Na+-driven multidrug efflux pump
VNSTDYLTEGHLFRGLITISLPIIASNILQSVPEVVDLSFVGMPGANAIAGVAMSTTIIFVLATFIVGLVTATTAFISRHYGALEHNAVGLIVQHSLFIGLTFSLAISVFGLFFSKDLLLLLGANEIVATLNSAYLSVLFLGIFTMIELLIVISSFQACGNSLTDPDDWCKYRQHHFNPDTDLRSCRHIGFWYCRICACNHSLTGSRIGNWYAPPCAVLQPHHIPENMEP